MRPVIKFRLLPAIAGFIPAHVLAADYPAPVPYAAQPMDAVNVDIHSRLPSFTIPDVSIGGSSGLGLAHSVSSTEGSFAPWDLADPFRAGLASYETCGTTAGSGVDGGCFRFANGAYAPLKQDGSTLTQPMTGQFLLTDRQGRNTLIDTTRTGTGHNVYAGIATTMTSPNGLVQRLTWDTYRTSGGATLARLLTVSTNTGYSLKYEYASDTYDAAGNGMGGTNWATLVRVTAYNRAFQKCSDAALHCTGLTRSRSASYSLANFGQYIGYRFSVQDAAGQITAFGLDPTFRITSYKPADSSVDRVKYINCRSNTWGVPSQFIANYGDPCFIYQSSGLMSTATTTFVYTGVKWVEKDGLKWIYDPNLSIGGCGCYFANTSKRPDGTITRSILAQSSLPVSMLIKASTPSETWSFVVDTANRVSSYTKTGSGTISYTYDSRGNVTQARTTATGSPDLVVNATYPTTCSGNVTCNKPTSVTDPNGNTTDYTYDPTHGGVVTVTGPAAAGVRPQKRVAYVQRAAVYFNDSGVLAQDSAPIWLVSRESVCRTSSWTGSTCAAGASDEVVTTYDYGPTTGANNLQLRGIAVTAGGTTLRTCYGYDEFGDRISETRPNANVASCS